MALVRQRQNRLSGSQTTLGNEESPKITYEATSIGELARTRTATVKSRHVPRLLHKYQ